MAVQAHTMPRMNRAPPKAPSGSGVPTNASALGADLVDGHKTKLKGLAKKTAHLPIVGIDLFAASGSGDGNGNGNGRSKVAYQPPAIVVEKRTLKNGKTKTTTKTVTGALPVVTEHEFQVDLRLKANDDSAHKAVKRLLKGNDGAMKKVLASAMASSEDEDGVVVVPKPANLLGARTLKYVSPDVVNGYDNDGDCYVKLKEQALDGSEATGDDFDRVALEVKLCKEKKAVTMFPEEAVSMLVADAKAGVMSAVRKGENDDDVDMYPVAVALPGWCGDAATEAAIEACGTKEQMVFSRGMCALAATMLVNTANTQKVTKEFLLCLAEEIKKLSKDGKGSNAEKANEQPLVLVAGLTASEGVELHFMQIGKAQDSSLSRLGLINSISSFCYQDAKPLLKLSAALEQITASLGDILPERKPCAVITYGCASDQASLQSELGPLLANIDIGGIPFLTSQEDSVSFGACALAAYNSGRFDDRFIQIKNSSTRAVGFRFDYFGGRNDEESMDENEGKVMEPITKTIFDFDRKVPTSWYSVELSAAECACVRSKKTDSFPIEDIKDFEGGKSIPDREAAAKDLRIQVVQKLQHDGPWIPVGNVIKPLCMDVEEDADGKSEVVGWESMTLTVSLSACGLISIELIGEKQSIVQALETKRRNSISYFLWTLAAIIFFGGFMFKSWYDDYRFQADTAKLLAYYGHVVPDTLAAGDEGQARYLVYKYRGRIDKLWRRLEVKYGVAVPDSWEDENEVHEVDINEEVDLDDSKGEDL